VLLPPNSPLVICVQSTWRAEHTTEATAREDLQRAEKLFKQVSQAAPELLDLATQAGLRIELEDDYGMGALLLCTLEGNQLHWASGFPKVP
jgi:hypothetical protein